MKQFIQTKVIKIILFTFLLFAAGSTNAQVGIGTNNPASSAQLDVSSTTKGLLPPRMTQVQRNAITTPAAGLMIWCSDCGILGEIQVYNGITWTNMTGGYAAVPTPATVTIGTQVWTTRNLDVVTYRNGDTIPEVIDTAQWNHLTTGAWCYYNNDPANGLVYGKLYNHAAVVDPRGLAPLGWHVPNDVFYSFDPDPYAKGGGEWKILFDYLKEETFTYPSTISITASIKMRATALWESPNSGITNQSGFTALPGGQRGPDGVFSGLGNTGRWWNSGEYTFHAYPPSHGGGEYYISASIDLNSLDILNKIIVHVEYHSFNPADYINYSNYYPAGYGLSVRCIKD